MQRRSLTLLLIAGLMVPLVGTLTASRLQAQTGERVGGGLREPGDRAERLIEDLDLTDAQVEQIRTIRQGSRDDMQTLHQDLRTERDRLHDLMASNTTEADLRAQHATVQTLHREAADQRFETMLAVREVLTPDQRVELGERMAQRRHNRRGLMRGDRHQLRLEQPRSDR